MIGSRVQLLSSLPAGFLDCNADQLYKILDGPTLINLPGVKPEPIFICTLLHGNETTGFESLKRVLKRTDLATLPRSVSIFIGNVEAARKGERRLPDQPDYNRIWCTGSSDEHAMTRDVLAFMQQRSVFACIDIHNNTGRNPHYAIIATLDRHHLALAGNFSRQVVYATYPDTSCSVAFSRLCPSITIEAGVVGDTSGVDHVVRYLTYCLSNDDWQRHDPGDVDLYHTVAVVKIKQSCSIGLSGAETDIELIPDVDRFNFNMLDPGTRLASARNGSGDCLVVEGAQGRAKLSDYLSLKDGELRTVKPIMPAMLTTDCDIIKMDCLCYLMEPMR